MDRRDVKSSLSRVNRLWDRGGSNTSSPSSNSALSLLGEPIKPEVSSGWFQAVGLLRRLCGKVSDGRGEGVEITAAAAAAIAAAVLGEVDPGGGMYDSSGCIIISLLLLLWLLLP